MSDTLYLDTETRSGVNINQSGVYRYINDEYFGVLLFTWAINDDPVQCWEVAKEPMPARLHQALTDPNFIYVIHNSAFDRRVIHKAFGIHLPTERIHDVMVQAYAHGFAGSLDTLSQIFKLGDKAKMKEGKQLIATFCSSKSRETQKYFLTEEDDPIKWHTFRQYAIRDTEAMRELYKILPKTNYPNGKEFIIWQYDQKMADRGMLMDTELAQSAIEIAKEEHARMRKDMQSQSDGKVQSATQTQAVLKYIEEDFQIVLPNLRQATIEQMLINPELPFALREILSLRTEASRSAHTKYRKILDCVDESGRLHDTIQFMGASRTGRDGGRVFQPQNLPRTTMWGNLEGKELLDEIDTAIIETKNRALPLLYSRPLDVLGNLLRSSVIAPSGKKIIAADLSNIEGRSLVWLANEEWKLDFFRKYDKGEIRFDNYIAAYGKAMNIDPSEVTKLQRQIGKVMELGLGYAGGVAAFLTFAAVYRLDIHQLALAVAEVAEPAAYADAKSKYQWAKEKGFHAGLSEFDYTACEYLKTQWRKAHPNVVQLWNGLAEAFRNAIQYPRTIFTVDGSQGKLKMYGQKGWAMIRLPSGRVLNYFDPRIEKDGSLSFMGVDGITKQWARIRTYSGKLCENVTSATARDVMFHRIPDIEQSGYEIIMRVHDEIVAQAPDEERFNHQDLSRLMSMPHDWCKDLPLAAAGFTGYRYRGKD